MPPFAGNGTASRLYPVSTGNFGVGDVFLVSTCDAKDLLLSTNNASSRIKFLTTQTAGTQSERMTILGNGNVGIGTASPVSQLQISTMLGFHAGGSSVIAHNAYYAPPPTSTWKCTVGSAGDSHPVAIKLWDGYTTFSNTDPSATLSANSTITWKTTMQICNTGNVGIGKEYASSRLVVKGEDHSSSHSALNVTDDNDASLLFVRNDGKVSIGSRTPKSPNNDCKFSVDGKVVAREILVTNSSQWADYVFNEDYKLPTLTDVENYIKTNKHLPGIPTTQEVEENGIALGEMQGKLLEKIEQLTLHVIRLQKENDALRGDVNKLLNQYTK
jgi:hypothetical protein